MMSIRCMTMMTINWINIMTIRRMPMMKRRWDDVRNDNSDGYYKEKAEG